MNIAVVGCAGRMGRMIIQQMITHSDCNLIGGTEYSASDVLGQDIGTQAGSQSVGILVTEDPLPLFAKADVVIDFTVPDATVKHAEYAMSHGTALVIGTTGLTSDQEAILHATAKHVPIVYAANMSVGITLLVQLVEQVTRRIGGAFDIEIVEMHHRHKRDAPSGTALALGRTAATTRGTTLEHVAIMNRNGITAERPSGGIGFTSLRGGDVIGDHRVIFAGQGERLELTHKATGRHIYANGAITAARWLKDQPPGLYTMQDVLRG